MATEAHLALGHQSALKMLQESNKRKNLVHEIQPTDDEFC